MGPELHEWRYILKEIPSENGHYLSEWQRFKLGWHIDVAIHQEILASVICVPSFCSDNPTSFQNIDSQCFEKRAQLLNE